MTDSLKLFFLFDLFKQKLDNLQEPFRQLAKRYYNQLISLSNSLRKEYIKQIKVMDKDQFIERLFDTYTGIMYNFLENIISNLASLDNPEDIVKLRDRLNTIDKENINNFVKYINEYQTNEEYLNDI